jgi:dihydrofolate reductase
MHEIIAVVAVQKKDRGIGLGPKLLTVIKDDQERAKNLTWDGVLIMGRKSYDAIPNAPLPGRKTVIITRNRDYKVDHPDVRIAHSLDEAIEIGKNLSKSKQLFIFGGGEIYKEAMDRDLIDVLEITEIETDKPADIFFPPYEDFGEMVYEFQKTTSKGTVYTFKTIKRKRAA